MVPRYTLSFSEEFEEVVLRLRRDQLRSNVRHTDRLTATTIAGNTWAGHLLNGIVGGLRDQIDSLGPASTADVVDGVVSFLAAGLQSLPGADGAEAPSMTAFHLARIRRAIDAHLREPGVTIEAIAAELGMSIGHLHRLFKDEPLTASQYLWSRRLDACCRDLAHPGRGKASVARIAFDWGFNDAAHFSRAFRGRFDCSPTEWRRRAVADTPRMR